MWFFIFIYLFIGFLWNQNYWFVKSILNKSEKFPYLKSFNNVLFWPILLLISIIGYLTTDEIIL